MKIIVDTNILFSALLKNENKFAEIILKSDGIFEFYSSEYLKIEIAKHYDKIVKFSGISKEQIDLKLNQLFQNIEFKEDDDLDQSIADKALELVMGVDINDIIYVALSLQFNAMLWTGDKKLIKGLNEKGFNKFISTEDLYLIQKSKIELM